MTASFGIEPGRKVEYIPLLEEALRMGKHRPDRVLIYNRPNMVIRNFNFLLADSIVPKIILLI